ncbi:MAG: site-2 protease family protein [Eudoraea sp.]|jgi:Zn-dependent protease
MKNQKMKGVLKLGKIAGIRIEVHWTFTLLLIWVVFLDIQRGGTTNTALMNIILIFLLFFCVVLHELGHALTAKRFNIDTKKITLLPIGGVASLEKMPEKPGQELIVALAGPAVNVIIAILLFLVVPMKNYFGLDADSLIQLLSAPSMETLLFYLFIANVMLVVFNLIPAFPMDGGRVFRALLTFTMDRARATQIAAGLGQALAVIFFMLGLFFNPFLILIALFIYIAAYSENQMVKQKSLVEGHFVKEALLTNITLLHPENSLEDVFEIILAGTEKDFVVTENGKIVGILNHKDIIKNAQNGSIKVRTIMNTKYNTMSALDELKEFFAMINNEQQRFFPVTDKTNKLIGAIDVNNVSEFLMLKTNLHSKS